MSEKSYTDLVPPVLLDPGARLSPQELIEAPAAEVHAAMDATTPAFAQHCIEQRMPIQCLGKKCCGCCRGEVAVTAEELEMILARMGPKHWKRVCNLRGMIAQDSRRARCPMLLPVTRECSIYDIRPASCRGYFAVSDPKICHSKKVQEVAIVLHPLWVVLFNAMEAEGRQLISLGPELVSRLGDHPRSR